MDPSLGDADFMSFFSPHHPLVHSFLRTAKILSCGIMVGTAVLFPIANDENFAFIDLTLGLFIVSAAVYLAINVYSLVKIGPCTAPIALFVLLQAVLSDQSSSSSLIPWLPLGFAFTSITTVAIHKICKRFKIPVPVTPDKQLPHTSLGLRSETSFRSSLGPSDKRPPSESYRQEPEFFERHGPSSHYTCSTHTRSSDICLSDVSGRCRSEWDLPTRSYFVDDFHLNPFQEAAHVGRRQDDQVFERNLGDAHHPLLDTP
ncbi:hypothetical protein QBC32DRAFT_126099 [Pseudoneurospora amorphoporcata]|uniref:Uncharacterized protein n=1 Tax=Pseudoneurospora amorphoporcata TaxID=241081 RepID=A0AAN6NW47_9PEZI|nr:hypothetical protein QBC32DRAFT_126099 [Pseudoneurospora amorphoporcata]